MVFYRCLQLVVEAFLYGVRSWAWKSYLVLQFDLVL